MGGLYQVLLAGCMSACCGLRGFMPLLLISAAARYGHIEVNLINKDLFPYLVKNDMVFNILVLLAIIEVVGDKLPSFTTFLDAFHLILRPISGALGALSFLNFPDPVLNYTLALGLGAAIALPIQSYRASCRIMSDLGYQTNYNLYLSLTEDVLSLGGAILALIIPPLAFPLILLLIFFALGAFKKWRLRIIVGEEEEDQGIDRTKDAAEVLEITRLKRLKKK